MDPRMSRTHRGLRSVLSRTCGFLQDWNARGGMLAGRRGPTGSLHVESRWKFSWNARVYGTCFFLSAALGLGTSRVCWDHILFSAAAEGRAALGQCNCGDGSRGSADTRDVVSVLPRHLRSNHCWRVSLGRRPRLYQDVLNLGAGASPGLASARDYYDFPYAILPPCGK